jgi:hypothetical protein
MAGSIAQISEKEESETDTEKELDSDLLAVLLPFIHSAITGTNPIGVFRHSLNFYYQTCEPIFLLVRNIRI